MHPDAASSPDIELHDGPLHLRAWRDADAAALAAAVADSRDQLAPWLPWCREDCSLARAGRWIADTCQAGKRGDSRAFAILDADGHLLGGIALRRIERASGSASLDGWVRRSHQGQGVATRAIGMVGAMAFQALALRRIELLARIDNPAARRCAEKAGACFSGIVPERLLDAGQYRPAALYSLLPEETNEDIAGAPLLHDGPLRLRAFRPNDLEALLAALHESMDSIGYWEDWCRPSYAAADGRHWIAHTRRSWRGVGDQCALAIVDRASDALLGSVSISQWHAECRCASLGYWVRQSCQGRGIASHAARLAASHALRTPALQRLEIVTLEGNLASRRVAEKAGARFEGIARCRLRHRGLPQSAAIYALTAADLATPA
jgi:RimJ/RimL family protein N-acetyltransferase